MKTVYIYGLTDPDGNIRYVGQSVNPFVRYEQHLSDNSDNPKSVWIRQMLSQGVKPGIVILEKTDTLHANYIEKWWIVLGRRRKWDLCNIGNPTIQQPEFGEMFSQLLRDDYDTFVSENKPILLFSKKHLDRLVFLFRFGLGLFLGVFLGWSAYCFEVQFSNVPVAFFYGVFVFVLTGYVSFFGTRRSLSRITASVKGAFSSQKLSAVH